MGPYTHLLWTCGRFVGTPRWVGDVYESAECSTEFVTSEEDWVPGTAAATCPSCEAELTENDDCPLVTCSEFTKCVCRHPPNIPA